MIWGGLNRYSLKPESVVSPVIVAWDSRGV